MGRVNVVILIIYGVLLGSAARSESLLQIANRLSQHRINPYVDQKSARQAGEKLFGRECSACHGKAGRGNGRKHTPPLATPIVRQADPGAIFWILRNGSGSHRMPSFSHLPEEQRWQIITYLQSLP
jgi:mono/diheme cytochrome c family protein